jgi:nicotinate phosphoribosyltransferase
MTIEPPVSLYPDPDALGPVTDLYQLTMMAGYQAAGLSDARATFELFVRRLPPGRGYLVFAGLEQAVRDLLVLRFSPEQIKYVRSLPIFATVDRSWFDRLAELRFTGNIWAAPEGSIVFAGEPLVRIEAPLPQAQWVETLLIASLSYPTLVASKAARIADAAGGRPLYDYGLRRGHGPMAGMLCARAAYLAGFAGTSNVEAARRLGIPCVGTMAHAWVQSFDQEGAAFAAFARVFGTMSTLLVDTYDTPEGVRHAALVEPPVAAVRLDSGELGPLAKQARAILDASGRARTQIVASGDLDEFKVRDVLASGAPIDAFGIGTELITSRDAPALSMVYKLVELDGKGRMKLSAGKKTYPMAKQVYRQSDAQGRFTCDFVTRADEAAGGEPLLVPIVRDGRLVGPLPKLDEIRAHCRRQRERLPEGLRTVDAAPTYALAYSDALESEAHRMGVN